MKFRAGWFWQLFNFVVDGPATPLSARGPSGLAGNELLPWSIDLLFFQPWIFSEIKSQGFFIGKYPSPATGEGENEDYCCEYQRGKWKEKRKKEEFEWDVSNKGKRGNRQKGAWEKKFWTPRWRGGYRCQNKGWHMDFKPATRYFFTFLQFPFPALRRNTTCSTMGPPPVALLEPGRLERSTSHNGGLADGLLGKGRPLSNAKTRYSALVKHN